MISTIAHDAIVEAAQYGEERRTFRGYRIDTRRVGTADDGGDLIVLTVGEIGGVIVLERVRIEVARVPGFGSACAIVPWLAAPSCEAPEEVSRWLCQPV